MDGYMFIHRIVLCQLLSLAQTSLNEICVDGLYIEVLVLS